MLQIQSLFFLNLEIQFKLNSPPPHRRSGKHVAPLQPRSDTGEGVQGPEGEQGAVSQGEAEAQRKDQQRGPGACSVAERRAADPHLHQRLQEHERLPHEEGAAKHTVFLLYRWFCGCCCCCMDKGSPQGE